MSIKERLSEVSVISGHRRADGCQWSSSAFIQYEFYAGQIEGSTAKGSGETCISNDASENIDQLIGMWTIRLISSGSV